MTVHHRLNHITHTMGSIGPAKDRLLVAFFSDLPERLMTAIQAKFPDAEISTVVLPRGADIPSGTFAASLQAAVVLMAA